MTGNKLNLLPATGLYLALAIGVAGCATTPEGGATGEAPAAPAAAPPAAPAAAPPAAPAAPAAAAGERRSVLAGVFTSAQATRGQQKYQQSCASCHAVAEFSGTTFQRIWNNRPIGDFYEVIATQMPMTAPGSLSPQEYTDIVTYILRLNGYPEGGAELAPDRAVLDRVVFEPLP
jgi:mono/diheme cytochrome c family protein